MLLMAAAAPGTPTAPGIPYTLPTAAPYNVDTTLSILTPYGDDQVVHPDVVDFGPAGWRGHRYWMGITPFPAGDPRYENPCIYVSDDGWQWAAPAGLVNPLDPGPFLNYNANSDTDLVYDPVADRLVLTYRLYHTGVKTEQIKLTTSTDGIHWSAPVVIIATDGVADGSNSVQQLTSQSMVRVSASDWRMWGCGASTEPDTMRVASAPEGPWSAPTACTFGGSGLNPYHADVVKGPDGRYWMLGSSGNNFFPAVSSDGVAWTSGPAVLSRRAGKWDANMYRPTLQAHENGTHMRVWYSAFVDDGVTPPGAFSSQKWRAAYTLIARSHWLSL